MSGLTRRGGLRQGLLLAAALPAIGLFGRHAVGAPTPSVTVWKDPNCGCCEGWAQHMRRAGFQVVVQSSDDMAVIKARYGVPEALRSCHTALIGGYVIEGHVPASDIRRLIEERPAAKGLAAAGMPPAAPGMDQPGPPYTVVLFGGASGDQPFARHDGKEQGNVR